MIERGDGQPYTSLLPPPTVVEAAVGAAEGGADGLALGRDVGACVGAFVGTCSVAPREELRG